MKDNKSDRTKCPKCGNKLQINTKMSLLSNPTQNHTWCNICGYKGYAYTHDSIGDNNGNR